MISTGFQIWFLYLYGYGESNPELPKGKQLHQKEDLLSVPVFTFPKHKQQGYFTEAIETLWLELGKGKAPKKKRKEKDM